MSTTELPFDVDKLEHTDSPPDVADQAPATPAGKPTPEDTPRRFDRNRPAPRPVRSRAPDAAPKEKPRKPLPAVSDADLKKGVEQLYAFAGVMLMPFDQPCATVIANSAGDCANALVELSKTNEAVRRVLAGLTQGGAWGVVITAHLPIVMTVASHHFSGNPVMASVTQLHPETDDEPPRTVRHTGPVGGQIGKFCNTCGGALVQNVKHDCPGKGA